MIQIEGLTPRQVTLLDIIWNFETQEDVEDWLISLDDQDRKECEVLSKMLVYAVVDEAIQRMKTFPDAELAIRRVKY